MKQKKKDGKEIIETLVPLKLFKYDSCFPCEIQIGVKYILG